MLVYKVQKNYTRQIHEMSKPPTSVVHLVSWGILFQFSYTSCRCYAVSLITLDSFLYSHTSFLFSFFIFFFFLNTLRGLTQYTVKQLI